MNSLHERQTDLKNQLKVCLTRYINTLVQILLWNWRLFQHRLVHKLLQLLFKKRPTKPYIFWNLMKNTTRKCKFNIPQIVVVENMANQILRFKNVFFENLPLTRPTIMFIIFWDFSMFYTFSFHQKWNDGWLLLIKMVYMSCLTSCQMI